MADIKVQIGKPYTLQQLRKMFGEDFWKNRANFSAVKPKTPITNFEQFDEYTKQVYLIIYEEVLKRNRAALNSKVYATGSRVTGTWKTKEEAEQTAIDRDMPVKYSDYDYWTDAPVKPTAQRLHDLTGEKIDFIKGSILVEIRKDN